MRNHDIYSPAKQSPFKSTTAFECGCAHKHLFVSFSSNIVFAEVLKNRNEIIKNIGNNNNNNDSKRQAYSFSSQLFILLSLFDAAINTYTLYIDVAFRWLPSTVLIHILNPVSPLFWYPSKSSFISPVRSKTIG